MVLRQLGESEVANCLCMEQWRCFFPALFTGPSEKEERTKESLERAKEAVSMDVKDGISWSKWYGEDEDRVLLLFWAGFSDTLFVHIYQCFTNPPKVGGGWQRWYQMHGQADNVSSVSLQNAVLMQTHCCKNHGVIRSPPQLVGRPQPSLVPRPPSRLIVNCKWWPLTKGRRAWGQG